MYVLGTAGHVDHGKSVLVRALTGMDPDRLPEEKARGMTIDLGFAWLTLPGGREVSIVDVPGHERFVKNMVAGVGGIDLALLVIAADEGVMPQTREHLAIIDLLNVASGVVVITKKDTVDEDELSLSIMEAEDAIKGSSISRAPIVAVSAITREGLPDLISIIDRLLDSAEQHRDIGRPRLPIDRVFTVRGFGTVVTGTLADGSLHTGQQVEVLPPRLNTHVRGIEVHKHKVEKALPGSRVAVNLGNVQPDRLQRGMVITTPGWLTPTRLLDVKLRTVSGLPGRVTHNMSVTFHTGTSEVAGRARLLDRDKLGAGESGWAQIGLSDPVVAARGDLFVIRSPRGTLGGGEIVDTHPKRHRRFQPGVIESLDAREGSPEEAMLALLDAAGVSDTRELALQLHLTEIKTGETLQTLVEAGRAVRIGSSEGRALFTTCRHWNQLVDEAGRLLRDHHHSFPLRQGMPRQELRTRLKAQSGHFDGIIGRLTENGHVVDEGAVVRLPEHAARLSPEQQERTDRFLKLLAESPYSPATDFALEPDLLNRLLAQRQVVRVGAGIIFTTSAYEHMVERLVDHLKQKGTLTIAEVRDLFQTSRKYAQALMEHLDDQKITRRVGDERVLR
ncbi:MAG: selenocysteine-specific translation elongation factor [Dehalococcoidia bacterium]